jgi:hypothetical protein
MKNILTTPQGDVEFESEDEIMRYFKGEIPKIERIGKDKYKAIFELNQTHREEVK